MSESLVMRVKRLMSASVNGLVDALENSNAEIVMREAVREIERATDDVRAELGRVIASRHQTGRVIDKTRARLTEMSERAKVAVSQGRDDLAEAALGRQIDLEAELPTLEAQLGELYSKQAELDGYVAGLEGRRREMEADIATFVAARETAAELAGVAPPHASVSTKAEHRAEQAQRAFDRAMNGPAGPAGKARADRETSAKLHELERLTRSTKIADRLAGLKSGSRFG